MPPELQRIAIVGYPGAGKTSLVEKMGNADREGLFEWEEMPGVHMLGRNTADEQRVYDALLGRTGATTEVPAGIIALADARDLSRQLYLVSQLIDLRLPILVGLSRLAEAASEGISVNIDRLGSALGVLVIDVDPGRPECYEGIAEAVRRFSSRKKIERAPHWRPSVALADAFHHVDRSWVFEHLPLHKGARFIEGLRLLTVPRAIEEYVDHPAYAELEAVLEAARKMLEDRNERWTTAEVLQRHNGLGQILQSVIRRTPAAERSPSKTWWGRLRR